MRCQSRLNRDSRPATSFLGQIGQFLCPGSILCQRPLNKYILPSLNAWSNRIVMLVNADTAHD